MDVEKLIEQLRRDYGVGLGEQKRPGTPYCARNGGEV